jgi:hypothetical protein
MGAQPTIAMPFQRGETASSGKKPSAGLKLLLSHWNWKAAVLSVSLRAPIFAVGTLRRGAAVLGAAVLTETAVSVFNAGFYGSIVQLLRNRKPLWLTGLLLVIAIPALGQAIEFAAHSLNHTPHRQVAILASSLLSALSALFNWYAMRHDALLVAEERTSFGRDLKRLPGLIVKFVWLVPKWIVKYLVSRVRNQQRS